MSFCMRACEDACLLWGDFQRVALNQRFHSVRRGDLRYFDWDALAAKLGISAEQLYALSERSFYVYQADPREFDRRRFWAAPWIHEKGYSCYSPAALQRSFHWRLEWSRPGQIIDRETETLLLYHCGCCKRPLRELHWPRLYPGCPCGHELIDDPVVKAPAKILKSTQKIRDDIDIVFHRRPVDLLSEEAKQLTATWYLVRELEQHRFSKKLYHHLADGADVGPYHLPNENRQDVDVVQASIRHAQLWGMADFACRQHAPVLRRYRYMLPWTNSARSCQAAVARGLRELADSLGG